MIVWYTAKLFIMFGQSDCMTDWKIKHSQIDYFNKLFMICIRLLIKKNNDRGSVII